jgi:hypothetical protein
MRTLLAISLLVMPAFAATKPPLPQMKPCVAIDEAAMTIPEPEGIHKPRVHPVKYFYDHLPTVGREYILSIYVPDNVFVPPLPIKPCLMKSRKRSKVDGRCYLEARLPENQK